MVPLFVAAAGQYSAGRCAGKALDPCVATGVMVTQKNVVITGATQGLGYGYAREFLRRGHCVALCGRSADGVAAAVDSLTVCATGSARVVGQSCEMARLAAVQSLWDLAQREFGRVDIFVNNAGYAHTGARFDEHSAQQIEAMINANVIGSMHAAQVAVAGMSRQGGGQLYLTLGGGGGTGRIVPGMSVYSSTKRAVRYLADTLIKERRTMRDDSILIGTISPGVNLTEGMLRELAALPQAQRAKVLKPLNFIGEHVETTTPWIVEQILANRHQGHDIVWLTRTRMLRRSVSMLFGARRDLLTRYNLKAEPT